MILPNPCFRKMSRGVLLLSRCISDSGRMIRAGIPISAALSSPRQAASGPPEAGEYIHRLESVCVRSLGQIYSDSSPPT